MTSADRHLDARMRIMHDLPGCSAPAFIIACTRMQLSLPARLGGPHRSALVEEWLPWCRSARFRSGCGVVPWVCAGVSACMHAQPQGHAGLYCGSEPRIVGDATQRLD